MVGVFAWLLAIIRAIWDFLGPYPTVRIEQIGTPENTDHEQDSAYDFIIVGG